MATPKQLIDAEAANEELQLFLFHLADNQESFVARTRDEGYTLDYTLHSLGELERYIKDKGEQIAWRNTSEDAAALRLPVWSYLGETFRKVFGGGWNVSLDDPSSINYGKWVISGFDEAGVEFDPLRTMQGYLLRGQPGSLRRSLEVQVRFVPTDLSDLAEDDA
ncbi:MAG TPA: hypothetical protein VF629_19225 [Hymenobacter sp.]|jgi:hypothetical protein|uniref:hypothetical protein n=1 Tax=Hymenobacter sp. TaxID=1898978 RepID=UPI002ED8E140